MSIRICDRCGDITLDGEGCTCSTPFDAGAIRRRHLAALQSARSATGRRDPAVAEPRDHDAAAAARTAEPTPPASLDDRHRRRRER
jgi:hypothetical protein